VWPRDAKGKMSGRINLKKMERTGSMKKLPVPSLDLTGGLASTPDMRSRPLGGAQTERPPPTWKQVEKNVSIITKGWGDQAAFIHNMQRQRYRLLKDECMTTIDDQRAALCRQDLTKLEKPPDLNTQLSLDSLGADGSLPRIPTAGDGSQTERLFRANPAHGIHRILNDRAARQRWLVETERLLGKEGSLAPFELPPPPKYVPTQAPLSPGEVDEEVDNIRSESNRIKKALHIVNCSMRKGSRFSHLTGQERANEMCSMQDDIRRLKNTTSRVVDSIGTDKEELHPPRYDFVKANRSMLHQSDPRVKVARGIRQSVLKMESMERIVLSVGAVEMERCNHIGSALLERNKKVQQRLRDQDPRYLRNLQTQQEWLNGVYAAKAAAAMWDSVWRWRMKLKYCAIFIQKRWRGHKVRTSIANQHVILALKIRMPKLAEEARARIRGRSIDMVKPFLFELSKNLKVRKAITDFRKKTVYLQRLIKDHLHRTRTLRAKLVTQFERVERAMLIRMIREKISAVQKEKLAAQNDPGGAKATGATKSIKKQREEREHDVDWTKMQNELHRMSCSDDVKHAMVYELLRTMKVKFILRKQTWKDDMAVYRSSLHQTLLFRTEVQEILAGTDLEHMANDLEGLAGTNKGMRELVKNMNKSLPVKPEFREAVRDEKMKDLVRQCLWLCSQKNFSIRLLLANQGYDNPVVNPPDKLLKTLQMEKDQHGSNRSLRSLR